MKDYQDAKDVDHAASLRPERLSSVGQRAMQGHHIQHEDTHSVDELQRRTEQLQMETQARELSDLEDLKRQATERMAQTDDQPIETPPDHNPQIATTELGKARQVEAGAEMPERKLFSDILNEGIHSQRFRGRRLE